MGAFCRCTLDGPFFKLWTALAPQYFPVRRLRPGGLFLIFSAACLLTWLSLPLLAIPHAAVARAGLWLAPSGLFMRLIPLGHELDRP